MKYTRIQIAIAALSLGLANAAAADCPLQVGEVGSFMTGAELANILAELPQNKGDFETSESFEARRLGVLAPLLNTPLYVLTDYDKSFPNNSPNTVRYDADNQRVLYGDYFFSNDYDPVPYALRDRGLIQKYSDAYISFNLNKDENILRTYDGSNAFGASTTITEVQWDILSVSQLAPRRERSYNPVFEADINAQMPSVLGEGMEEESVMSFDMPIAEATDSFYDIRPAVVFVLDYPYVVFDEEYLEPVNVYPVERNINSTVLVAEILCGLVVGEDGTVLDTAALTVTNQR
jgi:hypothetical protein